MLKRKIKQLLSVLLLILLGIVNSCNVKPPLCGDPASEFVQIWLVDKNDSSLVGTKYSVDSIKLVVDSIPVGIQIYHHTINFQFSALGSFNNSNYYLTLSKIDVDTIKMIVEHYEGKCFPYNTIAGFSYNSIPVSTSSGRLYKIVK